MLEAAVLHTIFCPYRYWLQTDRKITRRVHELIKDTMRSPFEGIGKPKPLRHALAGYWSRRISEPDVARLSAQHLTCVKAPRSSSVYRGIVMRQKTVTSVTLDVREDIRNGREPFFKIMQAVARLQEDEQLLLLAPFKPAPLFAMQAEQGF